MHRCTHPDKHTDTDIQTHKPRDTQIHMCTDMCRHTNIHTDGHLAPARGCASAQVLPALFVRTSISVSRVSLPRGEPSCELTCLFAYLTLVCRTLPWEDVRRVSPSQRWGLVTFRRSVGLSAWSCPPLWGVLRDAGFCTPVPSCQVSGVPTS